MIHRIILTIIKNSYILYFLLPIKLENLIHSFNSFIYFHIAFHSITAPSVAAEMLDILADCMREIMRGFLKKHPFYSLEFDGTSTPKSGLDSELLYIKVVVSNTKK